LMSTDVGKTLRVVVTASNAGGSGTATSTASAVIAPAPARPSVAAPVNTVLPVISGSAQQGQTLSASTGSWSNGPTSYAYQWTRCNKGGNNCSDIGGASGAQYALTNTDVGSTLRVIVTASNAGGSASEVSSASSVVAPPPAPPSPTPPPTSAAVRNTGVPNVTGPERVGKSIETDNGSWDGNPMDFAFQWLRCTSESIVTCLAIPEATRSSYEVTSEDLDRYVIVRVTASNGSSSDSATSKIGRQIKG
jgi:hypothetical protein